jgi:kynurenine formamidase
MSPRITDLTLTLYDGIRGLASEPKTTFAENGYNTTTLHLYSHAGTHMDAPLHFVDQGDTIDHVALDVCIGPAELIDLRHKEPNSKIYVEDLEAHAARIRPGVRLLLRTDWHQRAAMDDYRPDMPRISAELATWLVERKVALLGVETPSVASLRQGHKAELTAVHQILLNGGVVIVEGLIHLDKLEQSAVHLIVLPLKIRGCDGSPVRAVAIEE